MRDDPQTNRKQSSTCEKSTTTCTFSAITSGGLVKKQVLICVTVTCSCPEKISLEESAKRHAESVGDRRCRC